MNGYYRFKNGFYGPYDIPTLFHKKIDRTLNYQTPVWLDHIIGVARGDKEKHRTNLFTELEKLQETGCRATWKISEFFLREKPWLGHEIKRKGMKPKSKDQSLSTIKISNIT